MKLHVKWSSFAKFYVTTDAFKGNFCSTYCLKFHFWNLNGYSDLSAVEGIIEGWEGEWEGEETRGIQLGVKVTNGANVGRR